MNHRKFATLICTAAAALTLTACGGGSNTNSDSSTTSGSAITPTASGFQAVQANSTVGFVYSAYKDVGTSMDWWDDNGVNTYVMSTIVKDGTLTPLVDTLPAGVNTVTWAFATGDCSDESWAGIAPIDFIAPNVNSFTAKNINYILSTGGAAGGFTCSAGSDGKDPAQMLAFLDRYNSPNLIGIDFDIEGNRLTENQIRDLVNSIAAVQASGLYPDLRISFTLATLAASDSPGSEGSSIGSEGETVMQYIQASGLQNYYINLMVMDYSDQASASVCVVENGQCEMGKSAIQAAQNFLLEFNGTNGKALVSPSHLELTPLIGVNDITTEIFTVDDAALVAQYVNANQLGGLHYWSYDRDSSQCGDVQTTCSGVSGLTPLQYATTFLSNL